MVTPPARTYYTTFFDSARWLRFPTRPDDIIVATPYKAGTTWMLNIVQHLIFQDLEKRHIGAVSPWLDMRMRDFDEMRDRLAAQTHRRVIKTHLPLDGLPLDPALKYIFVGRDPRDIFMSLWNFYRNFEDGFFDPPDDPRLQALPRPPDDILTYWDSWISRGAIEGEKDGYPFWSALRQTQTWWAARDRANILFVHHADLVADLRGGIARIARFLDIPCPDAILDGITEVTSFSSMKRDAAVIDASSEDNLKGGAKTFINKGTNGRWRAVLDDARLAAYDRAADAAMTPDCRAWMETGGPVPNAGAGP